MTTENITSENSNIDTTIEHPKRKYVCTGYQYDSSDNKMYVGMVPIAEKAGSVFINEEAASLYTANKNTRRFFAGGVFEIEYEERPDGSKSIYPSTARYIERFNDQEACARWEVRTRAAETQETLHKRETSGREGAKTATALAELLLPIRKEYSKAVGYQKYAIEVAVLMALRRPVR